MLALLDPLLAPVARLMVARGVIFPDFVDRMKAHYVAAARTACEASGQKVTDSKLSAKTGLQRRDVARLRDGVVKNDTPRQNYLARLVALWLTDSAYLGAPLPRSGTELSFETLAQQVNRDVHPRTMLDALLAAKTVSIKGDLVVLEQSSYQPLAGSEDQIDYLARNTGDHISAAIDNVLGHRPPHFERAVHYSALTSHHVDALREAFRTGQMALLEDLSRQAAKMKEAETGSARFRAGGYVYSEEEETP